MDDKIRKVLETMLDRLEDAVKAGDVERITVISQAYQRIRSSII